MFCSRCEDVPAPLPESGTLYIAPPLAHTSASLRKYLRDAHIPFEEPYAALIAIPLAPGRLKQLAAGLHAVLSETETLDSKALIIKEGGSPAITDLLNMQPLSTLFGRVGSEWLLSMLRDERFFSHFQPIVVTERPDMVFAHEALLRGREIDGSTVYPDKIFAQANTSDLLFQVDRTARITAVREAARFGISSDLFINFNPSSIYDPNYCLRTTMKSMDIAKLSPENVVFEVVESSEITDADHLLGILSFYRERGFRIALDDLGAGYASLNLLTRLRPDFVKLDMQLVRDVDRDKYKAIVARKILELSRELGVETIAEGVETRGEWEWLRENGADYVQGYLFARPAAPPTVPVMPTVVPISAAY